MAECKRATAKARFLAEYLAATEPIRNRLDTSRCRMTIHSRYGPDSSTSLGFARFRRSHGFEKAEHLLVRNQSHDDEFDVFSVICRQFRSGELAPLFFLVRMCDDDGFRFYRVPRLPRNWAELRAWLRMPFGQWFGLSTPECDLLSVRFEVAARTRFFVGCGEYAYAALGGSESRISDWLSNPAFELVSTGTTTGHPAILEVHFTRRKPEGDTHFHLRMDMANHWAVVESRRAGEWMPEIDSTTRIEYGPKVEGVAWPIRVTRTCEDDFFPSTTVCEISEWAFEPTPIDEFRMRHYGVHLPVWIYRVLSGIHEDNWLVSFVRLFREPIL